MREKQRKKEEEEEEAVYRPGRHMPQKVLQISGMRSGWRCKVCRCMSSTKAKLDERKCNGSVAKKWETLAAVAAAKAEKDTDGHTRVHSGEVVWCSTCGAYADKKAHGMQAVCKGAPERGTQYGGMWGQLRKLMRRIHPKTGENMQEHCNHDGSPWGPGLKPYANLKVPEKPRRLLQVCPRTKTCAHSGC